MGSLIAINVITTNNLNPDISSFFFCTLLFYLFFEVFFSFFRKLSQRKSPIFPDNKHLHMLSYYKVCDLFGKEKANFKSNNKFYLSFSCSSRIVFLDNDYSRYWFFLLLIIYVTIARLYRLTKN